MAVQEQVADPGQPRLQVVRHDGGLLSVALAGDWTLARLMANAGLMGEVRRWAGEADVRWELSGLAVLDSFAALQLWRAWGGRVPASVVGNPELLRLLDDWQRQALPAPAPALPLMRALAQTGSQTLGHFMGQVLDVLALLGQLTLDLARVCRRPRIMPWADISNTIYDAGVRALGITALVGFLIGVVLSYLSALQLRLFGAETFIINILGMSIIRELGPLLAAILVAGRSGSAMTAQIGIMRVTEELDALSALGISHSLRLVLPKVVALALVLPLLGMWTSFAAMLGGMVSADSILDISYRQFALKLPQVVPLVNIFIGLLKSACFGCLIALIACHFGFRIKPNTESLGNETTNSVVVAITAVIMMDAVFAILFMQVGMPP